jgi:hypothetical protein
LCNWNDNYSIYNEYTFNENYRDYFFPINKISAILEHDLPCGMIVADENGFEVFFPRLDLSYDDIKNLNEMFEDFCLSAIHSVSDNASFRLYFKERGGDKL